MDLNKLRVMQMIQLALAKKGIGCHIDVAAITGGEVDAMVYVFRAESDIIESFYLSSKTESELLEWHAEIERV